MGINDLKRPVLRDRNFLEEQIGAEIALGVLASLDDAIEHNHEAALEYGAQILFDDVRKKIAVLPTLPQHIACYLFFDRNPEIQKIILMQHFLTLPEEYQNAYLDEAIDKLNSLDKEPEYYRRGSLEEKQLYYYKEVLQQIRRRAIANNDKLAAKLSQVKFILDYSCREFGTDLEILRKLPETIKVCYSLQQGNKNRAVRQEMAVTHPDENIRVDAVKDVIKMNSTRLRNEFPFYAEKVQRKIYKARGYQLYKGDIKKVVYLALADDPSSAVKSIIVNNINHKEVLLILAEKYLTTDPQLSRIAKQRGAQITQRANYSKAYQTRRKNAATGMPNINPEQG
jgi:hypothetical protein